MSPSKRNVSYDNSSIHSNSTNNASRVSLGVSVLLPLLFTVILLGNLLVLLTVRSFRVRHVPDLLVASLALVELTNDLGPIMISMIVSNLHPSGFDSVQLEALCQFYNWFSCCLRLSACFIATLVALDRLCATVAPFFYRISVTNANVLNLVFSVVLSAAFISSWPALGWGRVLPHRALCSFDFGGGFALFIALLGYIQLFFVLGSFIAVTWATTRHMKRLEAVRRGRAWTVERGQLRTVSDSGDGWQKRTEGARNTRWRESLQFIRMLGVAVFLFYLSWLPIVISITLEGVTRKHSDVLQSLSAQMSVMSSLLSPWIYGALSKHYRRAYIKVMKTPLVCVDVLRTRNKTGMQCNAATEQSNVCARQ